MTLKTLQKCEVCGIEAKNPVDEFLGLNRDGSYTCRECCKKLQKQANGEVVKSEQWDGKSLIAC